MNYPNESYGAAYGVTGTSGRRVAENVERIGHNQLLNRKTQTTGSYTVVSRFVYDYSAAIVKIIRNKIRVRLEATSLTSVDAVHVRPEHGNE